MTTQLRIIMLSAGLSLLAAWSWWLYEHGRSVERGEQAKQANHEWTERFTLQAQLATRDQQLAEAQAAASAARSAASSTSDLAARIAAATASSSISLGVSAMSVSPNSQMDCIVSRPRTSWQIVD